MTHSAPFDMLAETYDSDFTHTTIGSMQRKRVWSVILPWLIKTGQPLKILEINCGTGEDAIKLAGMGHQVTATDASEAMINKAKEKKRKSIQPAEIEFQVCPFDQLTSRFGKERFDLVFSNFGGLNCINEKSLKQLGKELPVLIKPGGLIITVLLSRCCIWEILHYGIRGQLKTAFRRFKSPVNLTVNDKTMQVFYYSPAQLKKAFLPLLKLVDKKPVGLFIPPSYLEKKFSTRKKRLQSLENIERKFGYSFLSSFGDHYCTIFKNREA